MNPRQPTKITSNLKSTIKTLYEIALGLRAFGLSILINAIILAIDLKPGRIDVQRAIVFNILQNEWNVGNLANMKWIRKVEWIGCRIKCMSGPCDWIEFAVRASFCISTPFSTSPLLLLTSPTTAGLCRSMSRFCNEFCNGVLFAWANEKLSSCTYRPSRESLTIANQRGFGMRSIYQQCYLVLSI